jgi:hypothetical protein
VSGSAESMMPPATTSLQPPILDAGPALNFTGPNGLASVPAVSGQPGNYQGTISLGTGQMFIPPGGGSFMIDNGSGGADIGAFKDQVSFPPLLVMSNAAGIGATINRSQPLTVQWTGGNPNGYISITGHSSLPPANNEETVAVFECSAPVSAGQFTIPSWILMALPPQAAEPGVPGAPGLELSSSQGTNFTAPGMTGGIVSLLSTVTLQTGYQ